MRAEAEAEQPVFDSLEEELRKATAVSNRMSKVHSERDVELDRHRQLLSNLQDRWKAVFTQIDLRQRDLDLLGRQLGQYRASYDCLIRWIADAKQRQEKIQAVPITDSKTLKEQLAQETVGGIQCLKWSNDLPVKAESSTFFLFFVLFFLFFCRNCWMKLRITRTKLTSVKNMPRHTLTQSR